MTRPPDVPFTLVETAAIVPTGVARVDLYVGPHQVGEVDFQICESCRRGIIHHVRIDRSHRRRGFARSAVMTILTRHDDYTWSTSITGAGTAAQAFQLAIGLTGAGAPVSCRHMRAADGPSAAPRRTPETPWSAARSV